MSPAVSTPDGVCPQCRAGDHQSHKPALAGICIGCTCGYRPGAVTDLAADSDPSEPPSVESPSEGPKHHETCSLAPSDLLSLLIEARNGIEWYRTTYPEADGRGDDEVLARIDAAIARETLHPSGEGNSAAVSFEAELMAAGDAQLLAESLAELGNQPVLIFTALEDEVRKAGPLFRKEMRFTATEASE